MVIAIDGPSGSGKTSTAKLLSKKQYDKLIEAFTFKKHNYIKGIVGQNALDGNSSWKFCTDLYGPDDWENLSFANVMINGNYSRFIKEMLPLFTGKDIVLVANENSKLDKLPFEVKKHKYISIRIFSC